MHTRGRYAVLSERALITRSLSGTVWHHTLRLLTVHRDFMLWALSRRGGATGLQDLGALRTICDLWCPGDAALEREEALRPKKALRPGMVLIMTLCTLPQIRRHLAPSPRTQGHVSTVWGR